MRADVLAKKLRARVVVLKQEREVLLKAYDKEFVKWKDDVARWLRTEAPKRIPRVKKSELERRYGCHTSLPNYVFEGIPQPPTKPSDEKIRDIQKTLRYIAFTGQGSIQVTQRQIDEWFGKEAEEDE